MKPISNHLQHWQVGILAFDQMELLDFAGPYEVFTTASRVCEKMGLPLRFSVQTIAQRHEMIEARAGLKIMPDTDFASAQSCDLLIVPGGVVDEPFRDSKVISWIQDAHQTARYTASICTGAFLLAQAEILQYKATTHWEDVDDLRLSFPDLQVVDNVRWIADAPDERVWSSAGISAGIDLSLYLLGRIAGVDLAEKTARQMDYLGGWQDSE